MTNKPDRLEEIKKLQDNCEYPWYAADAIEYLIAEVERLGEELKEKQKWIDMAFEALYKDQASYENQGVNQALRHLSYIKTGADPAQEKLETRNVYFKGDHPF